MKCLIYLTAAVAAIFLVFGDATASDSPSGEPVVLPIVMYHEVNNKNLGKDIISPWELESDLKYLRDNGYTTVTMRELIGYFYDGAALPPKPIILSFDDGYLNNYVNALPLLKKYDAKIVFSIIVKNTADFTRIPDSNPTYSHVSWPQLNEMLDTGLVEVQNHTYNLHRITKKFYGCSQKKNESFADYEQRLTEDLIRAQNEIFQMTGTTPSTFAYPYGRYNDNTDIILRSLGFQATLSCDYGINKISRENTADLYGLKRICRSHRVPVGKLLDEAYKTLR